MATCKQTAVELIQDVFSPCVAVLCSSDVEAVCAKNNLTFVELIQPFCRVNTEVSIRDPSNISCSLRNFRVNMKEMNLQLPPSNVGKKVMHDAVANSSSEGILCNSVSDNIYELKYSASTPWFEAYRDVFFQVVAPTEHEFMHHYLSCIFVVSSSCSDPLSQIHQLCQEQQQGQLQNSRQNTRWFFTYIFKYYLLLHDTSSENLAKAEAIFQSMKSCYGASVCHLLQINSLSAKDEINSVNSHEEMNGVSNLPDPWSQFLSKCYTQQDPSPTNDVIEESLEMLGRELEVEENCVSVTNEKTIHHPLLNSSEDLTTAHESPCNTPKKDGSKSTVYSGWGRSSNRNKKHGLCLTHSDMDRIRVFVQDFCLQGLVPFVEKQIRILNDQVTNRKSIHRTIFGVTKKLFTGNKPGVSGPVTSANSVVYGQDAPELQVRKLGDLAFMFQLYEVAYQAYHTAKRDFSGEAWLHFAGASEMAALSVFMQKNSNLHEYPARYMEAAITTYLYTCKLPELAIRATLLSTECLKAKGLYKDAAGQFSRILIEADLPSALLLEQAAHCAINCKPPSIRKYMFNLILAGHRFSKCGQRKHTLRSYKQVEKAYDDLGWNAAKNHIKSLIGRTSAHLKHVETAYTAFRELLSAQSEQASVDQSNCLRDYTNALKEYLLLQSPHENFQLQCLPIPIIDCQATKVLLGEENIFNDDGSLTVNGRGFERGDLDNEIWAKLEEMTISSIQGNLPPVYVPQLYCFTHSTNNIPQPCCVANETITVEVVLKNPLSISFTIDCVFLLWTFTTQPDTNSNKDPVSFSNELEVNKAVMLNSIVETKVLFQVAFDPFQEKKLHLTLKPVHSGSLLVRGLSYSYCGSSNQTKSSPLPSNLQGKQTIEVRGPRLNRTAPERASKTYAIDNRLNLKVVSSMAKLQVKYKYFPSSLFCGEVQQSSIELVNVGTQRMRRVVVASPTPSVFVIGSKNQSQDCQIYNEVPSARRPTPSVKEWETCLWNFEVKDADGVPCCLDAGESLSLPIWYRGPDSPGKYNLELLFYYETDLPEQKQRHRLVQHSSVLIAKPSLNLQAKTMTSQCFRDKQDDNPSSANSLLLSLVAGNISEELSEISVVQVSCASSLWHVSSSDELIPKNFPVILQRECLLMTLKARSVQPEKDSSRKVLVYSHVPLGCFEIDTAASPCADFISRSRIKPNFLDSLGSKNFDALDSQEVLLLLTVIWKAKIVQDGVSRIVTGQHRFQIENFISPSVVNKSPVTEISTNFNPLANQLVQCYIIHPFHIRHNFKLQRILTVPVEFIVQSTCDLPLQIILNSSDGSSNRSAVYGLDENQAPMSQSFTWVKGSKRSVQLDPEKAIRVPLHAAFCNPGTYNLGCLNVKMLSSGDSVINYIMAPFLITISACDAPIQ